jgi:hypothetical protein
MTVVDEQRDRAVQEADASCLASIQEAKSMYDQVVQALEARNTASIEEAHVRHEQALRVIEESYAESVGQIQKMEVEVGTAVHAVTSGENGGGDGCGDDNDVDAEALIFNERVRVGDQDCVLVSEGGEGANQWCEVWPIGGEGTVKVLRSTVVSPGATEEAEEMFLEPRRVTINGSMHFFVEDDGEYCAVMRVGGDASIRVRRCDVDELTTDDEDDEAGLMNML